MASDLLTRVPVDRIATETRQVQLSRVLLTLFAGLFFAIGWLVGKTWQAVCFAAVAVKVGFTDARASGGERAR